MWPPLYSGHFKMSQGMHAKIQALMEDTYKLDIPLVVDVGIGNSWQQAH